MNIEALIIILPIVTFALVMGLAWMSKQRTKQLQDDPDTEPSSLAKDQ